VFLDGKLICARQLLNGTIILQQTGRTSVEYFHVELDRPPRGSDDDAPRISGTSSRSPLGCVGCHGSGFKFSGQFDHPQLSLVTGEGRRVPADALCTVPQLSGSFGRPGRSAGSKTRHAELPHAMPLAPAPQH
jgi:hypothetical protein